MSTTYIDVKLLLIDIQLLGKMSKMPRGFCCPTEYIVRLNLSYPPHAAHVNLDIFKDKAESIA